MQTTAIPPGPAESFDLGRERRIIGAAARVFRALRRRLSRFRAQPRRLQLRDQSSRRRQARAAVESSQLHQGRRHGSRQDPARQRHHDQRGRLLAAPAPHDAALLSSARHRSLQSIDPRRQREIRRALGRQSGARRADQFDRRCQRTHPRDRAALDFRPRSRAPGAAIGRQSVRGRRQGAEPRFEIRLPLPLAHQTGRRTDRPAAARGFEVTRIS